MSRRPLSIEGAQARCKGDFEVIKWHGTNDFCQVKCRKCGRVSSPWGNTIAQKKYTCPCSRTPRKMRTGRPSLTEDQINQRLIDQGVEIVSGTYIGFQKTAEWCCHKCGYVWESRADSVLRKRSNICPECSDRTGSGDEFALLDALELDW